MTEFIITLFLGWAGVHKFMEKKNKIGLVYLLTFGIFGIGWVIDIFKALSKLNNSHSQPKEKECIWVVGEYYRHNDICSVVSGNPLYNLPDADFVKKVEPDKRIYRYKYRKTNGQLVPEPTNQHDKNAIKVIVENTHIGYIPSEQCIDLKKRINQIKEVEIHIGGGDYKYHSHNEVYKLQDSFNVKVYITT